MPNLAQLKVNFSFGCWQMRHWLWVISIHPLRFRRLQERLPAYQLPIAAGLQPPLCPGRKDTCQLSDCGELICAVRTFPGRFKRKKRSLPYLHLTPSWARQWYLVITFRYFMPLYPFGRLFIHLISTFEAWLVGQMKQLQRLQKDETESPKLRVNKVSALSQEFPGRMWKLWATTHSYTCSVGLPLRGHRGPGCQRTFSSHSPSSTLDAPQAFNLLWPGAVSPSIGRLCENERQLLFPAGLRPPWGALWQDGGLDQTAPSEVPLECLPLLLPGLTGLLHHPEHLCPRAAGKTLLKFSD